MRFSSDQSGFTLMELIVAVTLFSVAMVIITDTFLISTTAQRKAFWGSKVLSDSRLALGSMTDAIRSHTIDYTYGPYTSGIAAPVNELALRELSGKQTVFFVSNDQGICPTPESTPCLAIRVDDGETVATASITSEDVVVINAQFFISPAQDPFNLIGQTYSASEQPRVTISLATRSTSRKFVEQSPLYLQTTVSSRVYLR